MLKGFFLGALSASALLVATMAGVPDAGEPAFDIALDKTDIDRSDPSFRTSYANILTPAKEAVVAVHTANVVRVASRSPRGSLFGGLSRSVPVAIEERRMPQGMGSGVVISADGYILTNNHVIRDQRGGLADEVLVQLNDGREERARIVGTDPSTDIAVLKVDAADLPHLRMADSENLKTGDIVFAIGNPMGVGMTVTQGIVSATGRSGLSILGDNGYENFIQTDASINPGNSGGALVDAYGRLVGINTAILSRSGGNIGIGFAIPSTMARNITMSLIEFGEIRRGLVGVHMSDLTPERHDELKLKTQKGVYIEDVIDGLPAEAAGIRKGDVIIGLDGQNIDDANDFRTTVASLLPGRSIPCVLERQGQRLELNLEILDPNDIKDLRDISTELLDGVWVHPVNSDLLGDRFEEIGVDGLVITALESDSPYASGLREGMVILRINGRAVPTAGHAKAFMSTERSNRFHIYENGRTGYLSVRVR